MFLISVAETNDFISISIQMRLIIITLFNLLVRRNNFTNVNCGGSSLNL